MLSALIKTLLRFLICAAVLAAVWLGGFLYFLSQVPRAETQDARPTDAIVVLTGGKGRIDYGRQLLKQGKASRLFISGVEEGVTPEQLGLRGDSDIVWLGHGARNTIGNAMETAQWMQREKLTSLRLVTANYHMPRALSEFQETMPQVLIIPNPVLPENFDAGEWWRLNGSSQLLLKEYHKSIAAKLRHWLIGALEEQQG